MFKEALILEKINAIRAPALTQPENSISYFRSGKYSKYAAHTVEY